jgi:hypothetical protein
MSPEQSPGLSSSLGFFATAIVGAFVGAALSAAYLVTLPVKEVTEIPDKVEPELLYVLKGRTAGGDAWKLKASELKEGRDEITFLETELNRWANSFKTNYPEEKPGIYLEPQKPIFRLEGDKLLVSTKAESAMGAWKKVITLSLEGNFVPDESTLQIEPTKLYIGSLRVPGPLKDFVWKQISSAYTLDEEFESLWSSIETANIYESELVLTAKR